MKTVSFEERKRREDELRRKKNRDAIDNYRLKVPAYGGKEGVKKKEIFPIKRRSPGQKRVSEKKAVIYVDFCNKKVLSIIYADETFLTAKPI